MRHLKKDLSLLILLISLITAQWSYCSASSLERKDEEHEKRSEVDEEDWLTNASASPSSESVVERRKRSRARHRSPDADGDYIVETTTPAPAKLTEREIIQKILLTNEYDWRVRPVGTNISYEDTGGPVRVTVNIYLRSISKIDDVNMEYSAQFTFRETWIDRRLSYERMKNATYTVPSFIVLALSDSSQQIWMPDTFFQNEKEARKHMIDKPNVLIRIHPDGKILYSVRLSMVLSCPMSLEYYPLDEQKCLIDLASYAYTTADIVYEWKDDTPVQQKDGLGKSLPSFKLQSVRTGYCTSTTNTGQYSCLRTELILRREFSYYLLQLYIPSFMLVIVSWVSFWLDKDSVPARVTLGVTTLLTMTTQSSGINAKLPPVSYTKAIDVWIGVCLAFIFGALLEFALVNYAARKDIMRNVSGAMRRTRRPGISTGGGPPGVDPSLESLTLSNEGVGAIPGGPPPPPPPDEQCSYNTFMTVMCDGSGGASQASTGASVAGFGFGDGGAPGGFASSRTLPVNRHASYAGAAYYYRAHGANVPANAPSARGYESASSSSSCLLRQNPLLKTPPPMLRHPQDILPHATRNAYSALPRHHSQHPLQQHQSQQQYHQFPASSTPPPQQQQQQQPGSNGRLPSGQLYHDHQGQAQQQVASSQRQSHHRQRSCMDLWLSKYKERSKRIDVVSRLVFPVGFFIFNCVYWTVYML